MNLNIIQQYLLINISPILIQDNIIFKIWSHHRFIVQKRSLELCGNFCLILNLFTDIHIKNNLQKPYMLYNNIKMLRIETNIGSTENQLLANKNSLAQNPDFISEAQQANRCFQLKSTQIDTITYLKCLKEVIVKKQFNNWQQLGNQIIKVFDKYFQNQNLSWKIVVLCLNILCLIIQKQSTKKDQKQTLFSQRFIGNFLRLQIDSILKPNTSTQNSLCLILQSISKNKTLLSSKNSNLRYMFKQFCLELFTKITNQPKIIYNTLKLLEWLQSNKLLTTKDYKNYNLAKLVLEKTTEFSAQNLILYQMSYRFLINAGFQYQTYQLYKLMFKRKNKSGIEGFFKIFLSFDYKQFQFSMDEILLNYIFCDEISLTTQFLDFAQKAIDRMAFGDFLTLLERGFFNVLFERWDQVVTNNQILNYFEMIRAIQRKSIGTIFQQSLKDFLRISIFKLSESLNKLKSEFLGGAIEN